MPLGSPLRSHVPRDVRMEEDEDGLTVTDANERVYRYARPKGGENEVNPKAGEDGASRGPICDIIIVGEVCKFKPVLRATNGTSRLGPLVVGAIQSVWPHSAMGWVHQHLERICESMDVLTGGTVALTRVIPGRRRPRNVALPRLPRRWREGKSRRSLARYAEPG